MEESFSPKIDWWMKLIILFLVVMAALMVYSFFIRTNKPLEGIGPVLTLVVLVYLLGSTRYIVRANDLMILFGPLRFKYPFSSILMVKRPSGLERLETPVALKFAYSMNPLQVLLKSGTFRVVTISPGDEERFLRLLATRGVKVEFPSAPAAHKSQPGSRSSMRSASP